MHEKTWSGPSSLASNLVLEVLRCVNDWVKKLLVSSAFWESSEFRRTISVFFPNMASMRVVFILYMINRRFWQETVSVLIPIVVIVCLKVCILFIGTVFLV